MNETQNRNIDQKYRIDDFLNFRQKEALFSRSKDADFLNLNENWNIPKNWRIFNKQTIISDFETSIFKFRFTFTQVQQGVQVEKKTILNSYLDLIFLSNDNLSLNEFSNS